MRRLRQSLRLTAVVVVSTLCYVPLVLVALVTGPGSRLRTRVQSKMLSLWGSALRRVIGMRTDVIGSAPATTGIFVANHLSYVDIVLIASEMRAAFVAKREVRSWPVVGHVVTMAGTIYVDRQRHRSLTDANRDIRSRLDAGTSVVVFAEGSSTDGESVLPFRPSLLKIATDDGFPVNYGYLSYRVHDANAARERTRDEVCWWGDAGFFRHIVNLMGLPGFSARLVFGERAMQGSDRKSLARDLHAAVVAQFTRHRWNF